MSWPLVEISDIAEIFSGAGFPKEFQGLTEGDYPFAKVGDISKAKVSEGTTISSAANHVSSETASRLRATIFPTGSIVFAKIGEAIRKNNRCITTKEMAFDNNVMGIHFDQDTVLNDFAFRFLDTLDFHALSNSTTVPSIRKGDVGRIKIPLPPLEEQKRIAGILDQADALRRLRTRALDKLNTLGQAIFYEMFGDIARNSMDWPMGCIGDLLEEAKYGSSEKANTDGKGLPMLRMGNLTYDGQIDLTSLKHVELSDSDFEKYTTRKGDLLFNRTNSKELVGKTAVVKQEEPFAFAGYLVRGRANELGNTDYISAYLNSSHGKATLVGMCKNIVGMANINAKEMQKIRIAIPPKDLQDQFSVAIDALAPERKKLLDAIDLQGTLFASLQHRAFRGEL
tara:strand:- start:6540 stop:7730 length:1191 start_codon:yes stop_codon:yes gene_type:complete